MSLGMARVVGGLRGLLVPSRAPAVPALAPRHITISLQLHRSLLTSPLVRSKVGEEEEVVVTVGSSSRETRMTYRELKEKAAGRNLVRVKVTKKVETVPRFKIMSDVDLEIAARKQRSETGTMRSKEVFEVDGGRVKQKVLELKSRVNEDDLRVKTDKVLKWLQKGNFVNIVIKVAKNSSKKEAEEVKAGLEATAARWSEGSPELLGKGGSRLIITIK